MLVDLSNKATSARLAGGVGGAMFLAGAAITAAALALPHPRTVDTAGYLYLCAAQIGFGVVLLAYSRFDESSQKLLAPVTILGGILAIAAALYLNGERSGGPPLMNEFFFVWPALYAGYFYSRRVAIAVVLTITFSYCAVNAAIDLPLETVAVRTLITLSVVAGTATVAHALRAYVDALVTKLDRLARLDVLTGLANRRYFDEQLGREFARVGRASQPLSLLVGDVDHFKRINDNFGHPAGDLVLSAIGASLRAAARKVDTAARIGGEEFALLMPNTNLDGAAVMADRLRRIFAEVSDPAGNPVQITFGVSSTEHPDCGNADSLQLTADRALYAGKGRGRDQTITYADLDEHLNGQREGPTQSALTERLTRA